MHQIKKKKQLYNHQVKNIVPLKSQNMFKTIYVIGLTQNLKIHTDVVCPNYVLRLHSSTISFPL